MSMDAANLMAQAADLTQRAADLLAAGRVDQAQEADRKANLLRQRALREAKKARVQASPGMYTPAQSERDLVVEGLTELDAIVSPRVTADYVSARFQRSVSPRAFSSMRRDERKAAGRLGVSRATFVVPALDSSFFNPQRGTLALSSWPTWRRMLAPRTGRVELLRASQSVLQQLIWIRKTDSVVASRLERLLVTLVRTVPGAVDGWKVDNHDRVAAAVDRELEILLDGDVAARQEAAERAERQLEKDELLWGARPPHLVVGSGGPQ